MLVWALGVSRAAAQDGETPEESPPDDESSSAAPAEPEGEESQNDAAALNNSLGFGGVQGGWFANIGLSSAVGVGSFVKNRNARNPYVDYGLRMTPGWLFRDGTNLSASISMTQELTQSDTANSAHQVLFSDLSVRAFRSLFTIPKLDIVTIGSLTTVLPTSKASQLETLILGGILNLTFLRTFGPLSIFYTTGFRKNFHEFTTAAINTQGFEDNVLLAREGGAERIGAFLVSTGANNISFSFRNSLTLLYIPIPGLMLSLTYRIDNAFTYESFPDDEFAAESARGGRGRRDAFSANIDVSYMATGYLMLSTGVSTAGAPKTADNRRFRFPFFDTRSEAENLTTIYLAVTATLDGSDFRSP